MANTTCSLKICFVGAGTVNFGGAEHHWNHSLRLEKIGGVSVVAIVDPLAEKARAILKIKKEGTCSSVYEDCEIFSRVADALKAKSFDVAYVGMPCLLQGFRCFILFVCLFAGLPPNCHGSFDKDIELQLLQEGVHVFVEKPVSIVPPNEFKEYVSRVEAVSREKNLLVSVGYMFRYHPAVVKMKEVLAEYAKPIMAINARYSCTYSQIDRPFFWDIAQSGGPIVEQATHFCDIIRFLGGEVDVHSIMGSCIRQTSDIGQLMSVAEPVRQAEIPVDRQIPVVTQSIFAYQRGGLCSITHTATLQGKSYEANIDVWCDGLRMTLLEPYSPQCALSIRYPDKDTPIVYSYPDADPYYTEDKVFLDAVRAGKGSGIKSPYGDAASTYYLTWAIRMATFGR